MNKHAQALGKLAKGKPKNYSKAEIAKRTERIMKVNEQRILENSAEATVTQTIVATKKAAREWSTKNLTPKRRRKRIQAVNERKRKAK